MPTPSEHKIVQFRILAYAKAIGKRVVPRKEAEERRAGFPTRHYIDEKNGAPDGSVPPFRKVTGLLTRH